MATAVKSISEQLAELDAKRNELLALKAQEDEKPFQAFHDQLVEAKIDPERFGQWLEVKYRKYFINIDYKDGDQTKTFRRYKGQIGKVDNNTATLLRALGQKALNDAVHPDHKTTGEEWVKNLFSK